RRGEMANCREIPFIPYYGSVDAPPLFLMLLAEYWSWTADEALLRELWPTAERVLAWMLRAADRHDGYLTYARRSARGLIHPAVPRDQLQSRPPAVDATGERQPRAHRGAPPDGRRHVHRLGRAHAGQRRTALQPDELSQRLGVAARHRHRRRRHAPLRPRRAVPDGGHRPLRGGAAVREHADARALLRLPARGGLRAHPVPGGLRAAGVGGRRGVHADQRHAG